MNDKPSTAIHARRIADTTRFLLAGVCCGSFIVFVVLLARATTTNPLAALHGIAGTFWGVVVNFSVCLATAAFVAYRLRAARSRKDAR